MDKPSDWRPAVEIESNDVRSVHCDVLIVNLFEGVQRPGGATGAIDQALSGLLTEAIATGELTGKALETRVFHTWNRIPARRILVAGLGKREEFNAVRARQVAAAAARAARSAGGRKIASIVHGGGIGGLDIESAARALIEGTWTGLYRFDRYRKAADGSQIDVEMFKVVEADPAKTPLIRSAVAKALRLSEAVVFARDLGNEPPNVLRPSVLADRARSLAAKYQLPCQVWSGEQLNEAGFKAIYAVGCGSRNDPQLVRIDYRGRDEDRIDLALIGKGVTFDAGGLSLKPPEAMEEMKFDMCGAAAVLGTIVAIADSKPQINVMFLIPTVENLPGGRSLRPGDIIETYGGKTIEVRNTDAEGRLLLADAVAYARSQGAAAIVDVATLTGAAVIALGNHATALMGNDEQLVQGIKSAAQWAGERVWQLPGWPEYREQFQSTVADLKNVGGRAAGAITGGLIIGTFAENTPWAHLDIAGTAWLSEQKPYSDAGATGVMTRTLIRLCLQMAEQ